jgi:hypothetical protein
MTVFTALGHGDHRFDRLRNYAQRQMRIPREVLGFPRGCERQKIPYAVALASGDGRSAR